MCDLSNETSDPNVSTPSWVTSSFGYKLEAKLVKTNRAIRYEKASNLFGTPAY